jgi:hypothetical protein
MKVGQAVQSLMQKHGADGFAASPVYALQSILDAVENRALQPWNRVQGVDEKVLKDSAPLHQTLLAHEDSVEAAQFSPDGQRSRFHTAPQTVVLRLW